jgi:hypothetical protein
MMNYLMSCVARGGRCLNFNSDFGVRIELGSTDGTNICNGNYQAARLKPGKGIQ